MLNMACGRLGRIGFIRDWMTVYRIHSAGAWSGRSKVDQHHDLLNAIDICNQLFSYEYDEQFRRLKTSLNQPIIKKYGSLLVRAIKHPKKTYSILRSIILNP